MHVYCVADIVVAFGFKVLSLPLSAMVPEFVITHTHTHTHTKWLHKSPRFGPFCRGRDCKCPSGICPQWGYSGPCWSSFSLGYMSTARVAFSHCSIVNTTTRNDIDRHVPLPLVTLPLPPSFSFLSPLLTPALHAHKWHFKPLTSCHLSVTSCQFPVMVTAYSPREREGTRGRRGKHGIVQETLRVWLRQSLIGK